MSKKKEHGLKNYYPASHPPKIDPMKSASKPESTCSNEGVRYWTFQTYKEPLSLMHASIWKGQFVMRLP